MTMDPLTMALLFTPWITMFLLGLVILQQVYLLARHWVHPARILTLAATCAGLLLAVGTILNAQGVILTVIWWLPVVLVLAGVVTACVRVLATDPPAGALIQAEGDPTWGQRRTRRFASRPSWLGVAVTAVVLLAGVALAVWAG